MSKFIRLMDGTKSNAGGFKLKLNEINIAEKWNPNTLDPAEMGGFNFSTDEKWVSVMIGLGKVQKYQWF